MRRPTVSRVLGLVAILLAAGLTLGSQFSTTLGLAAVTGLCAVGLALGADRDSVAGEILTSVTLPVLGVLFVAGPVGTVAGALGSDLDVVRIVVLLALGMTAVVGAAAIAPAVAGTLSGALPWQVARSSGRLTGPLAVGVGVVYALNRTIELAAIETPREVLATYAVTVTGPVPAALFVTCLSVGVLSGTLAVLVERPLTYGIVVATEPVGRTVAATSRLLKRALVVCVVLAVGLPLVDILVVQMGRLAAVPAALAVFDSITAIATNPALLTQVTIATGYVLLALGVLWLLNTARWMDRESVVARYGFPAALPVVLGLSVTPEVSARLADSEGAQAALGALGPVARTLVDELAVLVAAVPLLGTVVVLLVVVTYLVLFGRASGAYGTWISFRNVGIASLFFVVVLAESAGLGFGRALVAVASLLVAWDVLEYDYTLQAELAAPDLVTTNELVHSAGILVVAAGGAVAAHVLRAYAPVAVEAGQERLLVALALLAGAAALLVGLRE